MMRKFLLPSRKRKKNVIEGEKKMKVFSILDLGLCIQNSNIANVPKIYFLILLYRRSYT